MKFIKVSIKSIYFVALLFILVLPACQTTSVFQFQTLEAPEILLPSDVNRIGFVSRNIHFRSDSLEKEALGVEGALIDSVDYDKIAALSCYQGLVENLAEFWTQDSIPFIRLPKEKKIKRTKDIEPLSWEIVSSICRLNQVDVLIVLEDIRTYIKQEVIEDNMYWAVSEINYRGLWRIYDPLYKKYYDYRAIPDTLFLEVSDFDYNTLVNKKLPSVETMVNVAAYELGVSYANFISPSWIDVRRDYFLSGSDRLLYAGSLINNDNAADAVKVLEELTKKQNKKLAGRAAYNLAVLYEMKGDFINAKNWINKAVSYYSELKNIPTEFKHVKAYSSSLDSCLINEKRINQFFGED